MTFLFVIDEKGIIPRLLVVPIGVERTEIRLALGRCNGKLFYLMKVLPLVFWMEDSEDVAGGVCWIIALVEVEMFENARTRMLKDCHVIFLVFGDIVWFEIPSWRKERSRVVRIKGWKGIFNGYYVLVGGFVFILRLLFGG